MDVRGTVEVVSWVLGFGDKALVLEPASLRDAIRGEHASAAKRATAQA
jgi:predicted DNA-binding transcriptional regulator YafY